MCCGEGTIKQKPSDVLKAIQEKKAATMPPEKIPPTIIPQAIKEQLIKNQQLLRLGRKNI